MFDIMTKGSLPHHGFKVVFVFSYTIVIGNNACSNDSFKVLNVYIIEIYTTVWIGENVKKAFIIFVKKKKNLKVNSALSTMLMVFF